MGRVQPCEPGAEDVGAAGVFYDAVLGALGVVRCFETADGGLIGWQAEPAGPVLYVGRPFDGGAASVGNGVMAAFRARDRGAVDAAYAAALAHGGRCEGAPGLRPQYGVDYYGAYMRDPAGNKLHVVHREAWGSWPG